MGESHYAGKDVKLDTPDRPIFWYKPTGADKYRVIHADLSVKDMTLDDVKKCRKRRPNRVIGEVQDHIRQP